MHIEALIHAVGHFGVAAIVFAESGLLIGAVLPGDSLLVTAGLLAAGGFLNIWILIPACIAAAIVGDSVGYATGKYFGPKIFKRENSIFFKKSYVTKTEAFFDRHGPAAIVIARFTPIIRTITPIMAGVGAMKYRTFVVYNILGGIVWAGGLLALSYVAGMYIPWVTTYIEYVLLTIVFVSIIPIIKEPAIRIIRRFSR